MTYRPRQSLGFVLAACLVLSALLPLTAQAELATMEQRIELRPGWNSVYVQVDPVEQNIATLFAGVPVASIWRWLPTNEGARFIQDPAEGLENVEGWFAWFPEPRPEAFLSNLFRLNANNAYLIRLEGSQNHEVVLRGRPRFRPLQWKPDAFTLTGLPVNADAPPTFGEFFSQSPAHQNQPVYRLSSNGQWQLVAPGSTPIRAGEAYWIHTRGNLGYQGRMSLVLDQGDSLEYTAALDTNRIVFRNRSGVPGTFQVRRVGANNMPLAFLHEDPETGETGWPTLPAVLNLDAPPGQDVFLSLSVVRRQFSSFRMEQILEISDEHGERVYLHAGGNTIQPFVAPGGQVASASTRSVVQQGGNTRSLAGLWLGEVSVEAVSESQMAGVEPTPVREPFVKRVIVHVDNAGQARLLKDVIQMWEDGTMAPSAIDPTAMEVDEPGRFVLITDQNLIGMYSGAASRNGRPVGLRYSTVAYDFPGNEREFDGEFRPGGQISVSLVMEPDFPTNPFLHRYHPDHDNLDEQFLNFKKEAYQVVREMRLTLTQDDPLGRTPPGWGETIVGGMFEESISGLHRNTIFTSGQFRMRRVSAVPVLNQ
jgi:hypothetical protein